MRSEATAKENSTSNSFGKSLAKVPMILWGLILLVIILGILSQESIKPAHLLDFTRQSAALIIVAVGQTIVMMIGGLDLSVGAVITLVDVVAAQMMQDNGVSIVTTVLICLAIGAVVGLFNGLLCVKLNMPAFIVTLGTSTLLLGITLIYSGGSPNGSIPKSFRFFGTGFVGAFPVSAFIWLIISAIIYILIRYCPLGHYIVSTGVNSNAVHIAGINEASVKIICYVLSSGLAAVSGLVLAAYIGTGSLQLGDDYQLRSVATAVLGGASFAGGKGSVVGTIFASLFIIIMLSVIGVLNLSSGWQSIVEGVIIFIGLLVNSWQQASE